MCIRDRILVELGKDADLGDEEVGVRDAVLVQILRQPGAVLDREAAQGRAAGEERLDLARHVGFEPGEQSLREPGFELESLHEIHASDGKSLADNVTRRVTKTPIGKYLSRLHQNP